MLASDFTQLNQSRAGGGFLTNETLVSTHLCMALGIATHLAHAVQYPDDAIESAYYALCQALRLNPRFQHVQPIAGTISEMQGRLPSAHIGHRHICPREDRSDDVSLSARQQRVLGLIAGGLSNKQIARSLGISPETVKTHVTNILIKLGVERRAQAVAFAHTLGMIQNTTIHQEAI